MSEKPEIVSKRIRYVVLEFDDGIDIGDLDRFDDCFAPDEPHPADVFVTRFAAGQYDLGPCVAHPISAEPGAVGAAGGRRAVRPGTSSLARMTINEAGHIRMVDAEGRLIYDNDWCR